MQVTCFDKCQTMAARVRVESNVLLDLFLSGWDYDNDNEIYFPRVVAIFLNLKSLFYQSRLISCHKVSFVTLHSSSWCPWRKFLGPYSEPG
jgi:hypothetical protein